MGYLNGGMKWCFRIPEQAEPEDSGLFEDYIECRVCRCRADRMHLEL